MELIQSVAVAGMPTAEISIPASPQRQDLRLPYPKHGGRIFPATRRHPSKAQGNPDNQQLKMPE